MSAYVTDTNALIWSLTDAPQLTDAARHCFEQADAGVARIYIPIISVVELIYLSERRRISPELVDQTLDRVNTPNGSYTLYALDRDVLQRVPDVPRDAVPDMPDRLIVATALALGLPLITSDRAIHAAALTPIIW